MKNKDSMPLTKQIFKALPLCVLMLSFGDIAYTATSPTVAPLEFKDTNGTAATEDDKIITMDTIGRAYRVAVDNAGNVYVTSPDSGSYKFNTNGHLVRTYQVNVPRGIAIGTDGDIYIGGFLNAGAIVILGQSGVVKGNLGERTADDMAVDSLGNIYTTDISGDAVNVINSNGILLNRFAPPVERLDAETINGTLYSRVRHTLMAASGIALDDINGEIYVVFRDYVDSLSNLACTGTNSNCTLDPDSYTYYPNTNNTFKYWYPAGSRYIVVVIDKSSGSIKRRLPLNTYAEQGATNFEPRGVALDNKGRLYVATVQGVKVYDALTGTALTVNGGFGNGTFMDLAFDAANGRILASTGSRVNAYSIDGGGNPANTPPSAPSIIAPANGAYANPVTVLKIGNATDKESDPLTYGYEIKDINGQIVSNASGIAEGPNGETSIPVSDILKDNTLFHGRAQSFDGNSATWSDEVAFCVNEKNDNPDVPLVVSPKDSASASLRSSYMTWNLSMDADCYDTVTYTVEVSKDQNFATTMMTVSGVNAISLNLDRLTGLVNGNVYYWRVKAVDNNGGESAYSTGSFTYKTTVVRFESDQPDTKVYIDGNYGYFGKLLGTTPIEVDGATMPGSHFVTFVKAGYEPYHKIINITDQSIAAGQAMAVSASMIKGLRILPPDVGVEQLKLAAGSSVPFVVDYNNDGLRDMVAGGGDGKVYLYIAEEQVQADNSRKVVLVAKGLLVADGSEINVGSRAVPFFVDYNNDGKKDLLVGSGDGLIHLYLNTGLEEVPEYSSAGTLKDSGGSDITVRSNAAPAVVDYNNDGKKDLVLGSFDGTLRIYLNIGSDEAPVFDSSPLALTVDGAILNAGSNSKAFLTDWNSDGKKDLIVGSNGSLNIYMNLGSDASPLFKSAAAVKQWIRDKKRERGNREYIPYIGHIYTLENLTGGSGDAAPFIVNWGGLSARDVVVGYGDGAVITYVTSE